MKTVVPAPQFVHLTEEEVMDRLDTWEESLDEQEEPDLPESTVDPVVAEVERLITGIPTSLMPIAGSTEKSRKKLCFTDQLPGSNVSPSRSLPKPCMIRSWRKMTNRLPKRDSRWSNCCLSYTEQPSFLLLIAST